MKKIFPVIIAVLATTIVGCNDNDEPKRSWEASVVKMDIDHHVQSFGSNPQLDLKSLLKDQFRTKQELKFVVRSFEIDSTNAARMSKEGKDILASYWYNEVNKDILRFHELSAHAEELKYEIAQFRINGD